MLSYNRKLDNPHLKEFPSTGPAGHSCPVGYRIKDTDGKIEFEREPKEAKMEAVYETPKV